MARVAPRRQPPESRLVTRQATTIGSSTDRLHANEPRLARCVLASGCPVRLLRRRGGQGALSYYTNNSVLARKPEDVDEGSIDSAVTEEAVHPRVIESITSPKEVSPHDKEPTARTHPSNGQAWPRCVRANQTGYSNTSTAYLPPIRSTQVRKDAHFVASLGVRPLTVRSCKYSLCSTGIASSPSR